MKMENETIPGIKEGEIKENDVWGEFNCDIFLGLLQMSQCTLSTTIIKINKIKHVKLQVEK
jgi:hypothetical protein